jgi:hypothetical protein
MLKKKLMNALASIIESKKPKFVRQFMDNDNDSQEKKQEGELAKKKCRKMIMN